MGSHSEPVWVVCVGTALLSLPYLVAIGLSLVGQHEAARVSFNVAFGVSLGAAVMLLIRS